VDLRHLRYFVAVAQELHFSRAADRLGVSQPPLSKQIADLERELGTPLLERTSRRVQLTEAGEAFLVEAQAVLAGADRAVEAARRAARGEGALLAVGHLGTTASQYIAEAAREFRSAYPAVQMYFEELSRVFREQSQALLSRRIDLALLRGNPGQAGITTELIATEPQLAVLPADHALAALGTVPLEALLRETFVGYNPTDEAQRAYWEEAIARPPRTHIRTSPSPMTVLALVAAGLGVTVLPRSACRFQHAGIAYRPLQPAPTIGLRIAWRTDDLPPTADRFAQILRKVTDTIPHWPVDVATNA
jgi:DNA-binding transcriptional LysR family regulator